MSLSRRLLIFGGFFLYFLGTYLPIQYIANHHLDAISMALPGEERIPFLPITFFIYISAYIFPLVIVFQVKDAKAYLESVKAYFFASLIHYVFFLLMPVRYLLRPELGQASPSILLSLVSLFYQADAPLNSFPSIHVSYAFLTYFCLKRVNPRPARVVFVWAMAIAVSTVFIKQHYIADVLAAIVLATAINAFYLRPLRKQENF